jgi:uncharacterized membrane protein YgcG
MAWSKRGYLQLVIKLKVQVDMGSYPTTYIIPPKMANKEHAAQVVKGWRSGAIKWVALSENEIEDREQELRNLPKPLKQRGVDGDGDGNGDGGGNGGGDGGVDGNGGRDGNANGEGQM